MRALVKLHLCDLVPPSSNAKCKKHQKAKSWIKRQSQYHSEKFHCTFAQHLQHPRSLAKDHARLHRSSSRVIATPPHFHLHSASNSQGSLQDHSTKSPQIKCTSVVSSAQGSARPTCITHYPCKDLQAHEIAAFLGIRASTKGVIFDGGRVSHQPPEKRTKSWPVIFTQQSPVMFTRDFRLSNLLQLLWMWLMISTRQISCELHLRTALMNFICEMPLWISPINSTCAS